MTLIKKIQKAKNDFIKAEGKYPNAVLLGVEEKMKLVIEVDIPEVKEILGLKIYSVFAQSCLEVAKIIEKDNELAKI